MKERNVSDQIFLFAIEQGFLHVSRTGKVWAENGKNLTVPSMNHRVVWAYLDENKEEPHIAVHRLVWLVYKGIIPPGYIVVHADKNWKNCTVSNLRLVKFVKPNTVPVSIQRKHKYNESILNEIREAYKVNPTSILKLSEAMKVSEYAVKLALKTIRKPKRKSA